MSFSFLLFLFSYFPISSLLPHVLMDTCFTYDTVTNIITVYIQVVVALCVAALDQKIDNI